MIVAHHGVPLSKTIVNAHILMGGDCMSKIVTKHAAIACNPVQYLKNFWENSIMFDQDQDLAERYLVRLWAGARFMTAAKTVDELSVESYTTGKAGIDNLPPTSSAILVHIHCTALLVHRACHLLTVAMDREPRLNLLEHGGKEQFRMLLPSKGLMALPQHVLTTCSCSAKCKNRWCGCFSA